MIRALTIALTLSFAAQAQYDAPTPAPLVYAPLTWAHDGKVVQGFWYTADQVVKIDARIGYLETRCAQECIRETTKGTSSFWLPVILGVAVGVALGAFVATRF